LKALEQNQKSLSFKTKGFTILHISDIHLESQIQTNKDKVLSTFLRDLPKFMKGEWHPDLIICTGDVAFSGKISEYEVAKCFFDELLKITGLTKKELFIVPGNHDVDPDVAVSFPNNLRERLAREGSDFLFESPDLLKKFLKKFHGYQKFIQSYFNETRQFNEDRYYFAEVVKIKGFHVGIAGLNSAWPIDKKSVLLGQPLGKIPLKNALSELDKKGAEIKICMFHHRFDPWVLESEQDVIRELLERNVNLVLNGHQDKHDLYIRPHSTYKWVLYIQAGPLRRVKKVRGDILPNRAFLIRWHPNFVEIKPLKFDNERLKWIFDTSLWDGIGRFEIPCKPELLKKAVDIHLLRPQKQIFKRIEEHIDERVRFPRKEHFERGLVYFDDMTIEKVKNMLMSKKCILLYGAPATRKTTFSLCFGLDMAKAGYRVFYCEMEEDIDLDSLLQEIESGNYENSIFIIDDCHKSVEKTFELVLKVRKFASRAKFLFVSRRISLIDPDYDYFELFEKEEACFELKSLEEIFEGVIRQFCISFKIKNYKEKIGDVKKIMGICGSNVLLLNYLLEAWYDVIRQKGEADILSETTRKKFLKKMAAKFELKERRDLLKICVLFQYEIPVPYDFIVLQNIDENKFIKWEKEGMVLVTYTSEGACYIMSHPSFARVLLECAGTYKLLILGKDALSLEQYSARILKRFLLTQEPSKWYFIFRRIYSVQNDSNRHVLLYLLNDSVVWENFLGTVKDLTLGQVTSLVDAILWVGGKKFSENRYAIEVRRHYLKYKYVDLREKLKSSSVHRLLKSLPLLIKLRVNIKKFFDEFSNADFQQIIKNSTVLAVRTTLFNLIQPKSYLLQREPYPYRVCLNIAQKIVEALITLPNDELREWIVTTKSLYRIGGLIGNIKQVDEALAVQFVKKLAQMDLDELFLSDDVFAAKRGFSKIQSLNYFLSKRLSFAPSARGRIISNIREETLSILIRQCQSLDELMWFIWNIRQENQEKAGLLVKENFQYLVEKVKQNSRSNFYLPMLGLLIDCDFDTSLFKLPEITRINLILESFKRFGKREKPSQTALVLSLIVLKKRLPEDKYKEVGESILKIINEMLQSPLHPDNKNKEVLGEIIKKYQL